MCVLSRLHQPRRICYEDLLAELSKRRCTVPLRDHAFSRHMAVLVEVILGIWRSGMLLGSIRGTGSFSGRVFREGARGRSPKSKPSSPMGPPVERVGSSTDASWSPMNSPVEQQILASPSRQA